MLVHCLLLLTVIIGSIKGQGRGYPGEILNGPQSHVLVPGELAYFNCHARGDNVYWYINNSDPHPQSTYEARGFSFSYIEIPRSSSEPEEHNNTITVEARPSNNNTRISCTAVGTYSNQQAFQEGTLIIAGPPSAPGIEFTQENLVRGFIHSHLSWSTPFTLSDFPVTNYTVTVFNHSNGETVTTLRTGNFTDYSHHVLSQGNHCYELDFTVVATNRVGRSPPATIRTGNPIVLGEIDEIETVVTFPTRANATPHLWMMFLVPKICPYFYQTGYFIITIYDVINQSVVHLGPTEYSQMNESEQVLVTNEFRTELLRDEYYTVEVVAESIGVVRVKRKNINTFIDGTPPESTTHIDSFNATSTTKPLEGITTSLSKQTTRRHNTSSVIAAGATIGAVISFITILIILVTVFIIRRRKRNQVLSTDGEAVAYSKPRKSKKTKPVALACTMASNPIYEGPVYEATPGEAIKSLISPISSTPSPPADLTPRYFDMPPSLPPPRNGSVTTQPKLEPVDEIDAIKASLKDLELPQCGDEYMVMNGVKQTDGNKDIVLSNGHAYDVNKGNSEEVYTIMK